MKLVSVRELLPDMMLAQDVYLEEDPSTAYLRRGFVLTDKAIDRLRTRRVRRVYIEDELPSKAQVFTPLRPKHTASGGKSTAFAAKPPASPQKPPHPPRRAKAAPVMQATHATVLAPQPTINEELREEAIHSLESTFETILINDAELLRSTDVLQPLNEVVGRLVQTVIFDQKVLVNINDLKSYDDYTYHHSLSVAVLSIAMGKALRFSPEQMNKLGMAAMMHDIGKTAVPQELIRKPSRLEPEEYVQVQEHVRAGIQYLKRSGVGDEKLWRTVLCHHEKMDGTGYPLGIKGPEIPLWSRIISVADVYDALTSNRPYRIPMQPADALEYIMGGVGSAFDYDVVQGLVSKIDLYPVGSCVELSNGELALVLDTQNSARPVVEILGRGVVADLFGDRRYLNVVIRRIVPAGEIVIRKG